MRQIRVKELKAGDEIVEYGLGNYLRLIVLEDARHINTNVGGIRSEGWTCTVKRHDTDTELPLFEADDCGAYGLELYRFSDYRDAVQRAVDTTVQEMFG